MGSDLVSSTRLIVFLVVAVFGFSCSGGRAADSDSDATGPMNFATYFGMNGVGFFHHPEEKYNAQRWRLMRELGVQWDRSDFFWGSMESKPGKWDFAKSDEGMRIYREHGIQMFPILDYGAAWHDGNAPTGEAQLAEWGEYVSRVVSRYKGYANYWEVWNEPNILPFWRPQPDAEAYAKLLRVTAEKARAANPEVKLVGFALADLDADYFERVLELAGTDCFDAASYHFYRIDQPELRTPDQIGEFRLILERFGKKCPLWVTEMGVTTYLKGGASEELQAVYLMRQILLCIGSGVERVFPFCLVDNLSDPGGEWGEQLGLTDLQYRKKPAFEAYRTMIAELNDFELVGPVSLGENIQALLFARRAGTTGPVARKLVVWSTKDAADVWMDGDDPTTRAEELKSYTTLLGEKRPLECLLGSARLMVTPSPAYVPVTGVRLDENARTKWEHNPMMSSPGHTETAKLEVALKDVRAGAIDYQLPDGWKRAGGDGCSFVVPKEAKSGWYSVRGVIPAGSGTVMKDLRVWVRPEMRVGVRPFAAPGCAETSVSFSLHNVNLGEGGKFSFSLEPPVRGVELPHGSLDKVSEAVVKLAPRFWKDMAGPSRIKLKYGGREDEIVYRVAVTPRARGPVVVDGDLAEFKRQNVPKVEIGEASQVQRGTWGGPADARASASVLWTGDGVYIGVEIADDHPMMNDSGTGGDVYKGDSFEVYLGTKGFSGEFYAKKENGYYHFALTPGKGGEGAAVSDFEKVVPGSKIAVKPRAGGYVMEAFIPNAAFGGYVPKAGDVIAFDMQLNDRDDYSRNAPMKSLMWNGDDMNWLKAAKWGMAVVK